MGQKSPQIRGNQPAPEDLPGSPMIRVHDVKGLVLENKVCTIENPYPVTLVENNYQ